MSLYDEIHEQPAVLERLLREQLETARRVAAEIARRDVGLVLIAARGSSDNAALYGKYLWGALCGLPVALATPSLFTTYGSPPRLSGTLVVGISQSGESPDIAAVVREGRAQGALTLAITNEPASPLAGEAELVLETLAGAETAVAATKTYTAQLLAIALVGVALGGDGERLAELGRVPDQVREALALEEPAGRAAERFRAMERCVVLGRGFNYATAYEWALKLKELTHVGAEPYSSADFRHGPVAMVSDGFPVLAVAPAGAVFDDVHALLRRLGCERGAELVVVSNRDDALGLARGALRLPEALPEWLSPIVSIVPGQLFTLHLTRAKGLDTERPRGLDKVTRTL